MGTLTRRSAASPAPRDQRRKLLAALLFLLLSLGWIAYYFTRGGVPKPTPQDVAASEAEHDRELERIHHEQLAGRPAGAPAPKPNGS